MISQLLSPEVIGGIKCLNAVISAEMTKKVISNAIKMALHTSKFFIIIHIHIYCDNIYNCKCF